MQNIQFPYVEVGAAAVLCSTAAEESTPPQNMNDEPVLKRSIKVHREIAIREAC